MCGIVGVFDLRPGDDVEALRRRAVAASSKQRHRGPDWSGVHADAGAVLAHERLAIVGIHDGAQPIPSADGALVLCVNGEIYNHRELKSALGAPYAFVGESDCEVINALWREHGTGAVAMLNGIFAFALWDAARQRYLIARDPIGVCPLYHGRDAEGRRWIASEMKALVGVCEAIETFPPGHLLDSADGTIRPYYAPRWTGYEAVRGRRTEPAAVREALMQAVRRQLMSDVPYGVLLSGGLDSSVIAWCAQQFAQRRVVGGDPAHRDVRRHVDPRVDADVPAGASDPLDGDQDGARGRGIGRVVRRLPVLPQGAVGRGVSCGDGAQAREPASL